MHSQHGTKEEQKYKKSMLQSHRNAVMLHGFSPLVCLQL